MMAFEIHRPTSPITLLTVLVGFELTDRLYEVFRDQKPIEINVDDEKGAAAGKLKIVAVGELSGSALGAVPRLVSVKRALVSYEGRTMVAEIKVSFISGYHSQILIGHQE